MDEFSAVSRRVPIWQLYERARSLGLAVQVSAQSWQGLAAEDDDRYRIAATADGGIWLLRTPFPDPVADLAGSRRMVDTTRRLLGSPLWSGGGYSRAHYTRVVDPDIVRCLDVGQAAYIYRGGVTYLQVKRLAAGAAELPGRRRCRRRPGRSCPRRQPGRCTPAPAAPAHRTAGAAARCRAAARRGLRPGPQMTPGTAAGGRHPPRSQALRRASHRAGRPGLAGPVRGGIRS